MGAGAVLVMQSLSRLPADPGKAAVETARYATTESGPVRSPGRDRAAGPTPAESHPPDQGKSPPHLEPELAIPAGTSSGVTDTDYLSPESTGALTRSSAPDVETDNVGAYIDPEDDQTDSNNPPVLVGEYLDPDSTITGD